MTRTRTRRRRPEPAPRRSFVKDVLGLDRPGPIGVALLIAAPVTAAALFYVWTHITTVRLGYELSEAGEAHRALLERHRALKLDVAALKAPQRLRRLGQSYGLGAPRPEQVVHLEERADAKGARR